MKAYAYLAAFLAALGAFWGVYHMGGASCRENAANAAREHLERQNKLVMELDAANQKREVIFRGKTKIVERVTDACTDVPIPDDIRLQLSGNGEK